MRFTAVDLETANSDMASICQIGVASYDDGKLVAEWSTLIDPEDDFDPINISIHGIHPETVRGKPTLPGVLDALRRYLEHTVCVCHTHFDRLALQRGLERYGLPQLPITWLDSARVARRHWQDIAYSGYGLANVCQKIGYTFRHHDALEDAKAAAQVLLTVLHESNEGLAHWQHRVTQPIDLGRSARVAREGNSDGDLHGEVLVFTGTLAMTRAEAADLAAIVGCTVEPGVTKRTTILVVGSQDSWRLAGHQKSSKHRKAEQLAASGQRVRIISEEDFRDLVKNSSEAV
jgi:DNA polymerase III subunit epsilon